MDAMQLKQYLVFSLYRQYTPTFSNTGSLTHLLPYPA